MTCQVMVSRIEGALRAFARDERGAALVEYGVILLVALAVGVASLPLLSDSIAEWYVEAAARLAALLSAATS